MNDFRIVPWVWPGTVGGGGGVASVVGKKVCDFSLQMLVYSRLF